MANSQVAVLPRITAPASRNRRTVVASSAGEVAGGEGVQAIARAFALTAVFGPAAWPQPLVARVAGHLAALRAHGMAALRVG